MANFNADIATNNAATPPIRNKTTQLLGRLRLFQATYTVPATGGPGATDTITWGALPKGAKVLGHLCNLNNSVGTGAAGSTLNVGDAASAARHLAATNVDAAHSTTANAQSASGALFTTSDDSGGATDNCTLISTFAVAAPPAGQVFTLTMVFVLD